MSDGEYSYPAEVVLERASQNRKSHLELEILREGMTELREMLTPQRECVPTDEISDFIDQVEGRIAAVADYER